ncbi:MAG: class I SAM-dependent methyltransferase [Bacteroidota bacterium]
MSKEIWNTLYRADEYVYGKLPNEFFRSELDKLAVGKLLLPAEGEGRNAVYAAARGWDVRALDQSEEGQKKALLLAQETGVKISYDISDILTADFHTDEFDAIALIFVHLPSLNRVGFHHQVSRWLKPGGTLIIEAFSKEQANFTSGGPKDPDMLFSSESLADDFKSLKILMNNKLMVFHNEGAFHRGEASVIRLIATKQL